MKWENVTGKLQKIGKDRFGLLFLAGLLLVFIAMPLGENEESKNALSAEDDMRQEKQETEIAGGEAESRSLEEYREKLCVQLKNFLQQVDGAGRVEVYITMHSSEEIILERNSPYSKRTEEETSQGSERIVGELENQSEVVLVEASDGSQKPVIVKEIAPVIEGVAVAAQGGDNEAVKTNITELLMALFGIEEHKIRVVKLNT